MPFDGAPSAWQARKLARTKARQAERCAKILAAREDPVVFSEYCGRLDNGKYEAVLEEAHKEWHGLWSDHDGAVILAPVGTAKTWNIRYRLIWEMGRDPTVGIAYLSATQAHPKKQLGAIKSEIETNHRIHQVFPHLKRATGEREVWSATEILIERDTTRPDVTLQCFGLYGNILGSRKNILVFDDICNYLNTLTEASREKMHDWVNEALSRLKGKVKVWAIGHIWHERDLLQRLAEQPGFAYARYEATTPIDPADPNSEHRLNFPRVLPRREINRLLDQINSPVFQQMMLWNILPDKTASRFRDTWFETCLRRGAGLEMLTYWEPVAGARVVCGVDLGHRKKIGSDRTVMITAVVYEDGTRRVIDIRAGNWTGSEIVENLEDVHDRFNAHIWVENNSAQQLLIDLGERFTAVPLYPHNTHATNKGDLQNGVEAIGRQMKKGKWAFPCDRTLIEAFAPGALGSAGMRELTKANEWLMRLFMDCKGYDPEKHTGDFLMALWILSEGIRKMASGEVHSIGDVQDR